MQIMEELQDYQASEAKELLVRKELDQKIRNQLDQLEHDTPARAQIIFTTYIDRISEEYQISQREAMQLISSVVNASEGTLICDGTIIRYRNTMLKCSCGARYSSILSKCPNKGAHG